jgi:hypothetical protein
MIKVRHVVHIMENRNLNRNQVIKPEKESFGDLG